jgi:uncharacterized membrane protein YgaE (UPF0421/DUF939 family)
VSLALRRSQRATQISAAARTITQRAPVTLTLARHRAQPTAATIIRLATCAVFAYLIALPVPETSPPVLAPLTAILVLQVSIYQTLFSAVRRVAAVVTGVLIALGLSRWIGFTWWSLGLTITLGLAVGYALRLREAVLEVPISAMLILSVASKAAATSRITETLIGTAAGLIAGFVLTAPQVEPAEEAIADLARPMAGLLDRMAAGLTDGSVNDSARAWLDQARALGHEIRRVDEALQQAEESTKLNPRSMRLPYSTVTLRQSLETLEHSAITVRVLARSLVDTTRLAGDDNSVNDPEVRRRLADTLRELSAAVRAYGSLATELDTRRHDMLDAELKRHLAAARDRQDRLSELLATAPAARPVGWPLRGELVSHLDRLRSELEAGVPDGRAQRRRNRPRRWPRPHGQRVPPAFRRLMR